MAAKNNGATWQGTSVQGSYDVVVVGAGIMGSATAYEVAKRGSTVLLLEQFDFLHRRGSSHGESRIIRMTYPEDYYTSMMKSSFALWQSAHEDAGFSVLSLTGGLDFGPPENPDLKSVLASCRKHKVEHEILTSEEVSKKFPISLPEGHIAVYTRDAGVLHATKACSMFQQLARKHGAVLRDRSEVTSITSLQPLNDKIGEESSGKERKGEGEGEDEGGVIYEVKTKRGTAVAHQVVVTAGAWTTKLMEKIGGNRELPVQPLHTTVAYWKVCETERFSAENGFPVFINYDEPFVYGMPSNELPGLIKVSLHAGPVCDPDNRDLIPMVEPIKQILKPWMVRYFGENVEAENGPVLAEACMYSMTPDQDFILDSVSINCEIRLNESGENGELRRLGKGYKWGRGKVFVAAGFSGHGFKMGPLIGKVMADLALKGESNSVPMEIFRVERFLKDSEGNKKESGPQVRPHTLLASL